MMPFCLFSTRCRWQAHPKIVTALVIAVLQLAAISHVVSLSQVIHRRAGSSSDGPCRSTGCFPEWLGNTRPGARLIGRCREVFHRCVRFGCIFF
jgi:hypothetical protein